MFNPRAYLSSSYPDLIELRKAARLILARHHFDGRGMEDYDHSAASDLIAKCTGDAARAELVVLVIAARYGTPVPRMGGRSLVEAEYDAAARGNAEVLAFCQEIPADEQLEESVARFRERVLDDGRLVGTYTDLADFELKLEKALIAHWTRRLEQARKVWEATDDLTRTLCYSMLSIAEKEDTLDAYVPLRATTTEGRRSASHADALFEPLPEEQAPAATIVLEDPADALKEHRQFYLAGEPGAGKTGTLRAIRYQMARRFVTDPRTPYPLLVDNDWDPTEGVDDVVQRALLNAGVAQVVPPARILLLVDGVIDSAGAGHERLEKIEAWLKKNPLCPAILAVRSEGSFERALPVVRLRRLDPERIKLVIRRRLADAAAAALLERTSALGKLLENPFNLGLVCFLHERATLPATRGELLREVIRFSHEREIRRHPGGPSWDAFVAVMGDIAIDMIRRRASLVLDAASARKAASLFPLAIDCGAIAPGGREFQHRLYVEFFAAEHLRRDSQKLAEILAQEREPRVARRYDEVLEALVQLDEVNGHTIVTQIAARDPFLAARCLGYLRCDDDARAAAEANVVTALVKLFGDAKQRDNAMAEIARLGVRAVPALRREMLNQDKERHYIRRHVVTTLAQIPDLDAIDAVIAALHDSNGWVCEIAAGAIRRFSRQFRELLLYCVASRREQWPTTKEGHAILDALADLTFDLTPEFAKALAEAAGIELDAIEEPAEVASEAEVEAEPVAEAPVESWGFAWSRQWDADRNNPELAASGRAWIGATSGRDVAWPYVWSALWEATPRDPDLDWLGRDWLETVWTRARSWSHVWRHLLREHPKDVTLLELAATWLEKAGPNHFGWNLVWSGLWSAQYQLDELRSIGVRWLRAADPNVDDSWSMIWNALWEERYERATLDEIGRDWLQKAKLANRSWGFVWPRLWAISPGDATLLADGLRWIADAPLEHDAWGHIWPRVREGTNRDPNVRDAGRKWIEGALPAHGSWGHIYPVLRKGKDGRELDSIGRSWLGAAPPDHAGWGVIWNTLWDRAKNDPVLLELGRDWLARAAPEHTGWTFVWSEVLAAGPKDRALLAAGIAVFTPLPLGDRRWYALWKGLWDFGGDRAWLAPLGRTWLRTRSLHERGSGFSFMWERLWAFDGPTAEWCRLGLDWLRSHRDDPTWRFVATPLADSNRHEVAALAREIVEREPVMAKNWPHAWHLAADVAGVDPMLIHLGQQYVLSSKPDDRNWPPLWCRLPIRESDTPLLERGWKWMDTDHYRRTSWPVVWDVLWRLEPFRRVDLAKLACDWRKAQPQRAEKITRWDDVRGLLGAEYEET